MKTLCIVLLTISLMACSATPSLPSYKDSREKLRPVNPDQLTQEQINAVQQEAVGNHSHYHPGGRR